MKKLLVFLFLLAVPFAAHAQAQGVHGKVLNPSQFSLYDTIVHITSAQIKADSATPVTLVPAQGAGTIINPLLVIVSTKHTDGTTYTNTSNPTLYASLGTYGIANAANVNDQTLIAATNLCGATTNTIMALITSATYGNSLLFTSGFFANNGNPITDSIANQPLILKMDHAIAGPGTATMDVEVIYSIHKQ